MRVLRGFVSLARTSSGALLTANLFTTITGAVTGVTTSRVLGPAGRGDLAVIVYWAGLIAAVADLSLRETITLRTADPEGGLRVALFEGGVLAALCAGVSLVIGWSVMPLLLRAEQQRLLGDARSYLAVVPVMLLTNAVVGALLGLQRYQLTARLRMTSASCFLGVLLWVAVSGWLTPQRAAYLILAQATLFLVLGGVCALSQLPSASPAAGRNVIAQARSGLKLQVSRVPLLLGGVEDRAIANWTLTQAQIGIYQIPATVLQLLPVIPRALGMLLFAKLPGASEKDRAALTVAAYARSLALGSLLAIVGIPLLPIAVPLIYGEPFSPAVIPAAVVLIGSVIGGGATALQHGARARLHVAGAIQAETLAMVVVAGLAWPLTRVLDLLGLALAYVSGRVVSLLWMIGRGERELAIASRDLFPWSAAFRRSVRADWHRIRVLFRGTGG